MSYPRLARKVTDSTLMYVWAMLCCTNYSVSMACSERHSLSGSRGIGIDFSLMTAFLLRSPYD